MNKKLLKLATCLALIATMVFTTFTCVTVQAASKKLTSRDKSIMKAYVKVLETLDSSYIEKYVYPNLPVSTGSNSTADELGVVAKVN